VKFGDTVDNYMGVRLRPAPRLAGAFRGFAIGERIRAPNQPFRVNVAAAEILSAGAAISLNACGWNPRLRIQSGSIASHREKAIRSPFLA
jgi:hypothetical protein